MAYPGRNSIYEATIKRMVNRALEAQEREFRLVHGADTEGQLLCYLCRCARELGHTPWPREIVGGSLIEERFGSWQEALLNGNLPTPELPDKITGFTRYQEETQRQKETYRRKKAEKKQKSQQRLQAQKERRS